MCFLPSGHVKTPSPFARSFANWPLYTPPRASDILRYPHWRSPGHAHAPHTFQSNLHSTETCSPAESASQSSQLELEADLMSRVLENVNVPAPHLTPSFHAPTYSHPSAYTMVPCPCGCRTGSPSGPEHESSIVLASPEYLSPLPSTKSTTALP